MTLPAPVRVLIVDDSATVRAVLRRLFARADGTEVAGEAAGGEEAVAETLRLRPDVVLMDIEMPGVDGYAATERIMSLCPTPILVLTSRAAREQVRTAFEALRRGALEVIPKPADSAGWEALALTLPQTVRTVAGARLAGTLPRRRADAAAEPSTRALRPAAAGVAANLRWPAPAAPLRWVAVGASTGGPTAVRDMLAPLPADAPVSVLVVQHIAAGFEHSFAEWLASELHLDVRVAVNAERPGRGQVRIAPTGIHLLLGADGLLHFDAVSPPRRGHRPSADDLFHSCALAFPAATAGVLLTGMGSDGAEGLAELRRAGGVTVVQDEATSVVFGMPRAALECGAADTAMAPRAIGEALARCVTGVHR